MSDIVKHKGTLGSLEYECVARVIYNGETPIDAVFQKFDLTNPATGNKVVHTASQLKRAKKQVLASLK